MRRCARPPLLRRRGPRRGRTRAVCATYVSSLPRAAGTETWASYPHLLGAAAVGYLFSAHASAGSASEGGAAATDHERDREPADRDASGTSLGARPRRLPRNAGDRLEGHPRARGPEGPRL